MSNDARKVVEIVSASAGSDMAPLDTGLSGKNEVDHYRADFYLTGLAHLGIQAKIKLLVGHHCSCCFVHFFLGGHRGHYCYRYYYCYCCCG